MKVPEHIISQIEAFKSGTLTKNEILEGNGNAISEQDFDQYIDLYEKSLNAIELKGVEDELKSIHAELFKEEAPAKSGKRNWIMAASILLVAAFAFLIAQTGKQSMSFDDVFEPYNNLVSVRGEEGADMTEAMRLYSLGQYATALNVFDAFSPDTLINEYYFYRGITAMAIDSFELAQKSFSMIGVDRSNPYWQQTKWYLALTYWQLEQNKEAAELLNKIGEDEFQFKLGQELLEQLPD